MRKVEILPLKDFQFKFGKLNLSKSSISCQFSKKLPLVLLGQFACLMEKRIYLNQPQFNLFHNVLFYSLSAPKKNSTEFKIVLLLIQRNYEFVYTLITQLKITLLGKLDSKSLFHITLSLQSSRIPRFPQPKWIF